MRPRNFAALISESINFGIAAQLASAAVVYPFLCIALGAPAAVASLIYPISLAASFAGMGTSHLLERWFRPQYLLATLLGAISLLIFGAAAIADTAEPYLLPLLILLAIMQGAATGVASVTVVHLLSTALNPLHRPHVSVIQTVGSGLVVLLITAVIGLAFSSSEARTGHAALLIVAALAMAISAISCLFVQIPSARLRSERALERLSIRETLDHARWMRRWFLVQTAFFPVTLGVAFYATHAGLAHARSPGALHALVAFSATGALLFGIVWFWIRKRLRLVTLYAISATLAIIAASLEGIIDGFNDEVPVAIHGATIMLAGAAALAATSSRQAWLLAKAEFAPRRVAQIAQAFTATGSIVIGLAYTALDDVTSIWPSIAMGGCALLGLIAAVRYCPRDLHPHNPAQPQTSQTRATNKDG